MTAATTLIRGLTFATLTLVWSFGFLWLAVPLSVWYIYQFRAYELVVLGVLIDVHFLTTTALPLYTAGFLMAVGIMELLKPRLRQNNLL